jgi:hypothetical protein
MPEFEVTGKSRNAGDVPVTTRLPKTNLEPSLLVRVTWSGKPETGVERLIAN